MKLYFVRHGETEWNVKKKIQGKTDIPLNENGIRQAKELACQLVEEDISVKHVYHSPQLRAAETARIAAGSAACDLYSAGWTGGDEPWKLGRFQLACDRAGKQSGISGVEKRPPLCAHTGRR